MKKPTFLEGSGVALLLAVSGSLAYAAFAWALSGADAIRLTASGIGLAYVLYLLLRSRERVGRVVMSTLWLLGTAVLWLWSPPLSLCVAGILAMIWVTRSLYFHQGLAGALLDLGLTGLGLIGALGAFLHTGSLFLSLWCLFLIQALFVYLPTGSRPGNSNAGDVDRFRIAHQQAEAALNRLSSHP